MLQVWQRWEPSLDDAVCEWRLNWISLNTSHAHTLSLI
ncbi:hypothetical protein QFZ94_007208 [Paraburkholderia sp. JPY465]